MSRRAIRYFLAVIVPLAALRTQKRTINRGDGACDIGGGHGRLLECDAVGIVRVQSPLIATPSLHAGVASDAVDIRCRGATPWNAFSIFRRARPFCRFRCSSRY